MQANLESSTFRYNNIRLTLENFYVPLQIEKVEYPEPKRITDQNLENISFWHSQTYSEQARSFKENRRENAKKRRIPQEKVTSISQALDKHNVIILFGEPGSGRTTLTKYLALQQTRNLLELCQKRQAELSGLVRLDITDQEIITVTPRLPVFIQLNSFAIQLAQNPDLTLSNFIYTSLHEQTGLSELQLQELFTKFLTHKFLTIILDGLDEIPEVGLRYRVTNAIQIFLLEIGAAPPEVNQLEKFFPGLPEADNSSPTNQVVIVCCIAGYKYTPLAPGSTVSYRVSKMTQLDSKNLLQQFYQTIEQAKWKEAYLATNTNLNLTQDLANALPQINMYAKQQANALWDALALPIDSTAQLELTYNPLTLSLVALLQLKTKVLTIPQCRFELYQQLISFGASNNSLEIFLSDYLAISLQNRQLTDLTTYFANLFISNPVQLITYQSFYSHLNLTSQEFWHLTFQEFLVVSLLLRNPLSLPKFILEKLYDFQWKNCLELLVGGIATLYGLTELENILTFVLEKADDESVTLTKLAYQPLFFVSRSLCECSNISMQLLRKIITSLIDVYDSKKAGGKFDLITQEIENIIRSWRTTNWQQVANQVLVALLTETSLTIEKKANLACLLENSGWATSEILLALQQLEKKAYGLFLYQIGRAYTKLAQLYPVAIPIAELEFRQCLENSAIFRSIVNQQTLLKVIISRIYGYVGNLASSGYRGELNPENISREAPLTKLLIQEIVGLEQAFSDEATLFTDDNVVAILEKNLLTACWKILNKDNVTLLEFSSAAITLQNIDGKQWSVIREELATKITKEFLEYFIINLAILPEIGGNLANLLVTLLSNKGKNTEAELNAKHLTPLTVKNELPSISLWLRFAPELGLVHNSEIIRPLKLDLAITISYTFDNAWLEILNSDYAVRQQALEYLLSFESIPATNIAIMQIVKFPTAAAELYSKLLQKLYRHTLIELNKNNLSSLEAWCFELTGVDKFYGYLLLLSYKPELAKNNEKLLKQMLSNPVARLNQRARYFLERYQANLLAELELNLTEQSQILTTKQAYEKLNHILAGDDSSWSEKVIKDSLNHKNSYIRMATIQKLFELVINAKPGVERYELKARFLPFFLEILNNPINTEFCYWYDGNGFQHSFRIYQLAYEFYYWLCIMS